MQIIIGKVGFRDNQLSTMISQKQLESVQPFKHLVGWSQVNEDLQKKSEPGSPLQSQHWRRKGLILFEIWAKTWGKNLKNTASGP